MKIALVLEAAFILSVNFLERYLRKSELVDLKLFRIPGDESGTTRIVRYVHEDICVRAPKIWKTINSTDIPVSRMDKIL